MSNIINPRLLKGFRDFLPEELRFRKQLFKVFEGIFEKYGYEPLETPALEYFDTLMGKYGEEEKLVYQFEDFGGRKVAMKYDLTVPTARVLAQYPDKIRLPWKKYQIQPVWRADNTQKGRFREFYQCDVDVVGVRSMLVEAELLKLAIELFEKLGFKEFIIRINSREILGAIAKYAGSEDKFFDIVVAIDKWDKRTPEETKQDLLSRGFSERQIGMIFECITLQGDTSLKKLENLGSKIGSISGGARGIRDLEEIIKLVDMETYIKYDPTIARGLAYYTGPIYEVTVIDGGVGSIAGGGRYDKLIGSFLGQELPACGISFGIERIIEVIKDKGIKESALVEEKYMVALMEGFEQDAFNLANKLRGEGKIVFLYPEVKKLSKQFEYADKKGFTKVYLIGEEEKKNREVTVRDMKSGQQETYNI